MNSINNNRINSFTKLISPKEIREQINLPEEHYNTIINGREDICKILSDEDDRFLIITGPCSIHDYDAAMEYAKRLKVLRDKYKDKLYIVLRIYFEKPRTIVGWKGLINDPNLNNTNDLEEGLLRARKILIDTAKLGIPTATEILDPIIAAYLGQLVSWVAIGARTTESQTHRQMTSGLSAPVGFKNGTNGNLDIAINAIKSAAAPHNFIGIDDEGFASVINTKGNPFGHIVLRGGEGKPNYKKEDIEICENKLQKVDLKDKIIVDCSHDNSNKDYTKQNIVVKDILNQKESGNKSIIGIMLESNINEGKQAIPYNLEELKYGVSVTDGCIGWEETEELIEMIYNKI